MPVETVTNAKLLEPVLPAPCAYSPHAAASASFKTKAGRCSAKLNAPRRSNACQPCKVSAFSAVTRPSATDPVAATAMLEARPISGFINSSAALTTLSGERSSLGVGTSERSSKAEPSHSVAASFVPPMSSAKIKIYPVGATAIESPVQHVHRTE